MKRDNFHVDMTRLITHQRTLVFTAILFSLTIAIFLNLNTIRSPIFGTSASVLYLLISSIMMGQALFRNENFFTKLLLGCLLVLVTLGLTGWVIMILHNLDNTRTAVVLFVTASLVSILNKRSNSSNETE